MKYLYGLSVLVLLISTSACSKKNEPVPQQAPAQADAAPVSNYGRAIKSAENVVRQSEKSSSDFDSMMDE